MHCVALEQNIFQIQTYECHICSSGKGLVKGYKQLKCGHKKSDGRVGQENKYFKNVLIAIMEKILKISIYTVDTKILLWQQHYNFQG